MLSVVAGAVLSDLHQLLSDMCTLLSGVCILPNELCLICDRQGGGG